MIWERKAYQRRSDDIAEIQEDVVVWSSLLENKKEKNITSRDINIGKTVLLGRG